MKKIITSFLIILLVAFTFTLRVNALDDYVNADEETVYGWHLVGTEDNKACWEFTDGELTYCYAADGDYGDPQHVNNFAIRNLAIDAGDSYSVEATFIPSEDTNASIERTYGIVCYYQDADNYLIYWLQQKPTQWSGQFYGRVGGMMRYFYIPEVIGNIDVVNYFRGSEFADMWWDDSKANNSKLVGDTTSLCTNTVTLKVESEVVDLELKEVWSDADEQFHDETYHCRKFTLHEIVDGEDFSMVYYIRDLDEKTGDFYTGLYSNGFNYNPSNFTITTTTTNFAENVEELIDALPADVTSTNQFAAIEDVRVKYEDLLGYKENVKADSVTKLEETEAKVGKFIDDQIMALDNTVETYKDDVDAVSTLFNSLSVNLQNTVTRIEELSEHIQAAKTWKYQSEEDDPITTTKKQTTAKKDVTTKKATTNKQAVTTTNNVQNIIDDATKGGCSNSITLSVISLVFAVSTCGVLIRKKH